MSLRKERVPVGHARAGTQAKDSGLLQNQADELSPSSCGSAQYIWFSRYPVLRKAEKSELFPTAAVGADSVSAWSSGVMLGLKMDQPLKKYDFRH